MLKDPPRRIVLSERGQEIASELGIGETVEKLQAGENYTSFEWYADEDTVEAFDSETAHDALATLRGSSLYRHLSYGEQYRAERVLKLTGVELEYADDKSDYSWNLLSSEVDTESLLGDRKVALMLPLEPRDAIVLSGVASTDIFRRRPHLLERHTELGFNDKLDMAIFVGAACVALAKDRHFRMYSEGGTSRTKISEGVHTVAVVGGDLHGDFKLSKHQEFSRGSNAPLTGFVEFAPVERPKTIAAYHSTEPNIVAAVLKHMYLSGLSVERQHEIIAAALEAPVQSRQGSPFAIPFADYGVNDFVTEEFVDEIVNMEERYKPVDRHGQDLQIIDRLLVFPQDNASLDICSNGDELVMRMRNLRSSMFAPELTFTNNELSGLLAAFIQQAILAKGRTAPAGIVPIMQARLKVLDAIARKV